MRLAILASHPIQYHAPLFRELAGRLDLHVFFAHRATPAQQGGAGFGVAFDWDVDLTSGYSHSFLRNVARAPDASHFAGSDTPDIGICLQDGKFDAVLSLGWHLKSLLQGVWAARHLGLPVMVRGDSQLGTPRAMAKRLLKEFVYPIGLRAFDAALFVGERSKAYFRHYRMPEERLFFSPHCVDTDWFARGATVEARRALRQASGIPDEATVLLFAGKLVPFKRPVDVVAAAARLRAEGASIEVLVAGAGELEGEMIRVAKQHAVPLHMLGFQNQSAMPVAYAACDILVVPSNGRETWGLVANEALACGRPIVVSDACGCAPDLTGDGTAGRTFGLGDLSDLAKALSQIAVRPPGGDAIRAKSLGFSVSCAAEGIVCAATQVRRSTTSRAKVARC